MGRHYDGDIIGKFWFGIQDSNDITNLITMDSYKYYIWKGCGCNADIEHSNYCNILDAFTGVFDNSLTLLNSVIKEKQEKQEKHKLEVLAARYTLGYQIEYCLRKTGVCNVACEF